MACPTYKGVYQGVHIYEDDGDGVYIPPPGVEFGFLMRRAREGENWSGALRRYAADCQSRGVKVLPIRFASEKFAELACEVVPMMARGTDLRIDGCQMCAPHGMPGWVPGFLGEMMIPCPGCAKG